VPAALLEHGFFDGLAITDARFTPLDRTAKRAASRSVATRRCIPLPAHHDLVALRMCTTVSDGSSSISLLKRLAKFSRRPCAPWPRSRSPAPARAASRRQRRMRLLARVSVSPSWRARACRARRLARRRCAALFGVVADQTEHAGDAAASVSGVMKVVPVADLTGEYAVIDICRRWAVCCVLSTQATASPVG